MKAYKEGERMLENNHLLKNRYRIHSVIGEGGMSVVYKVYDELLHKYWALKQLKGHIRQTKDQLKAELELQKNLNHPSLVRIVDMIVENDTCYLVMDYIDGWSLEELLKREKFFYEEEAVQYALDLCDVLSYLHQRGIVFRDLKPSNIMKTKEGKLMLIDFGIARMYRNHIVDQVAIGTKGYAAPEQYANRIYDKLVQCDERSDIYALGATLYHLLTGEKPCYIGDLKLFEQDAHFSEGLHEIIYRCTRTYQKDRYQSIAQLQYSLQHYQYLNKHKKHQFIKQWMICILWFCLSLAMFISARSIYLKDYFAYEQGIQEAYAKIEAMCTKSIYQKQYDEAVLQGYQNLMNKAPKSCYIYQSFMDYCNYFRMHEQGLKIISSFVNSHQKALASDEVLCYLGELYLHGNFLNENQSVDYQKAYDYFSKAKSEVGKYYAMLSKCFLSAQEDISKNIEAFRLYNEKQPKDEAYIRNALSLSYVMLQHAQRLEQEGYNPYSMSLEQIQQINSLLNSLNQNMLTQRYQKLVHLQESAIYIKQAYQYKKHSFYRQARNSLENQLQDCVYDEEKYKVKMKIASLDLFYDQQDKAINIYKNLYNQQYVPAMIAYGNLLLTLGDSKTALQIYEEIKKHSEIEDDSTFISFQEKLYYGKLIGED